MRRAISSVALLAIAACGGRGQPAQPATLVSQGTLAPVTLADRLIALLPQGAQVVVEVDLARLRTNPVVGAVVTQALAGNPLAGLPDGMPAPPLAAADRFVLAAYGVGTTQAATVVLLAVDAGDQIVAQAEGACTATDAGSGTCERAAPDASTASKDQRVAALEAIPEVVRVADGIYALGPIEWTAQVEQRAVLSLGETVVAAPEELLELRDHAMPEKAPGASLRITARLPADARATLATELGLSPAPARLSVWADVVDDFVIIVDASATETGDKATRKAVARLEAGVKRAIIAFAEEPAVKLLGLTASLDRTRIVAQGSWVRAIAAVGPQQLQRVVARAKQWLEAPAAPAPAPAAVTGQGSAS